MNRSSIVFLQIATVASGIVVLTFMLWEPHLEGRNTGATLFQIYFNDPFLAYAYTSSIAFFVAVYQTFKLLGYIGRNEVFSERAVHALRLLKYCSMAIVALTSAPIVYLFVARPGDDIAGGVAIGLFIIFVSSVVAANAAMHERIWQKAIAMKTENDLTV